ncbi:multidrug effflux MFS transporter [Xinfangfangia sp. D13-10-4-6]|uniref:multidrug effflux MFS transporter n=1 Tax=Pseudogemmobacter hezensis TaxID=2737662 RepID=UPI001551B470|nr:multidrug effflux MFS transporter [Pseudogemmobacter hezensis]NPD15661.1 multidrug effflux MFS transporter [Pseudogemmobacter hezensis]
MNTSGSPRPAGPNHAKPALGQVEFIALIAMLFATIALSIDAMLPAITEIGQLLSPEAPNRAMLIIGAFFLGMGLGTFVSGPLSDAWGRKTVMMIGGAIYSIASLVCYFAGSLEVLIAARVVQGIGAAGPRTVSLAMVRDMYSGREMARIMSFAMMIFMVAPAIAPLMGQAIIHLADWHAIFLAFVIFSVISLLWLGLRQPETLPLADRIPLNIPRLMASTKDLFSHRIVVVTIVIQALVMAVLVSQLSSIAPVFEKHFGRGTEFPLWFALAAVFSALGSLANARLVMTVGMRRVVTVTFAVVLTISVLVLISLLWIKLPLGADFALFMIWLTSLFCMMSLTMGNLNALAMEPVGHIAGFAASIMAGVSTVLAVVLSLPVTQSFTDSHLPLVAGSVVFLGLALALMRLTKR